MASATCEFQAADDVEVGGPTDRDWSDESNAIDSDNNTYASTGWGHTNNAPSRRLRFKNLDVSAIPAGCTIVGVEFEIERYGTDTSGSVKDLELLFLDTDGSAHASSDDKASGTAWATSDPAGVYATYPAAGGATDDWGLGAALTLAFLQDADVGIGLRTQRTGFFGTANAYVDHARAIVYYTEPPSGKPTHFMHYAKLRAA